MHIGNGCVLASTLCKYDLRKGDLFVLNWARLRRVRPENFSTELQCVVEACTLICYCLLPRCLETIHVCIMRMFVFMYVVVIMWGSVGMFVV